MLKGKTINHVYTIEDETHFCDKGYSYPPAIADTGSRNIAMLFYFWLYIMIKKLTFVGVLTGLAMLLLINSCKKNNAPGLIITSPLSGQDVATDDSMLIAGTATDDHDLHEFYLQVTNTAGDTVYSVNPYVHGSKSYPFKFNFHTTDTGIYLLTITGLDHDFESYTQSVSFHASYPPQLTILSPTDSLQLLPTDSLHVKGFASHEIGLSNLSITGVSYASGDTIFRRDYVLLGALNYNFDQYFAQTDTGAFYVNVSVDNYRNEFASGNIRYFVRQ
jgi:hypothetical protein